jgi:hypothetical protein
MWYLFRQNNSGGYVVQDKNVDWEVYIEAPTPRVANARAEDVGIYFNGVKQGRDCSCCGDRWNEVDEYSDAVLDYTEAQDARAKFCKRYGNKLGYAWVAHHLNGTIERGTFPDKRRK